MRKSTNAAFAKIKADFWVNQVRGTKKRGKNLCKWQQICRGELPFYNTTGIVIPCVKMQHCTLRKGRVAIFTQGIGYSLRRSRRKTLKAIPHNSRLTAQAPLRRLRHGICVAKMLDNVGLRYPHRASGAKAPRTLRPLPLLRFAVSATGGAHLCSIQYYLRFWPSSCRTSLAVSALRIMRYCL